MKSLGMFPGRSLLLSVIFIQRFLKLTPWRWSWWAVKVHSLLEFFGFHRLSLSLEHLCQPASEMTWHVSPAFFSFTESFQCMVRCVPLFHFSMARWVLEGISKNLHQDGEISSKHCHMTSDVMCQTWKSRRRRFVDPQQQTNAAHGAYWCSATSRFVPVPFRCQPVPGGKGLLPERTSQSGSICSHWHKNEFKDFNYITDLHIYLWHHQTGFIQFFLKLENRCKQRIKSKRQEFPAASPVPRESSLSIAKRVPNDCSTTASRDACCKAAFLSPVK